MPLTPGSSKKTIGKNIAEFHTGKTYARTAAKFGKKRADKQAIAVALSEARKSRKRAKGGAIGILPAILGGGPIGVAASAHARPNRASGGGMDNIGQRAEHIQENQMTRQLMHGPILSNVPGRTDAHMGKVASGSYVVPADIVSGRGQGNTIAGMNVLQKLFKMGPYGASPGSIRGGRGAPAIRAPHAALHMAAMPKAGGIKFKSGGVPQGHGKLVPVNLAGGELVIPPENLRSAVHPNLKHAHAIMDQWVLHERKKLRKTLAKLPGPARD